MFRRRERCYAQALKALKKLDKILFPRKIEFLAETIARHLNTAVCQIHQGAISFDDKSIFKYAQSFLSLTVSSGKVLPKRVRYSS